MKRQTDFAQLLLHLRVRDHIRRTGQKPDRRTYARLHYHCTIEHRRRARLQSKSRRWLRWLLAELREA